MKANFSVLEIRKIYNAFSREGVDSAFNTFYTFSMSFEVKNMLESKFQKDLVKDLKNLFPEAMIYKNEGKQGLPDLTVLWKNHWALLECKKSEHASRQPNQEYYIEQANKMSFARFIYPENKQEVLNELQQAFRDKR